MSTRFFTRDLYRSPRDTIGCTRNCALVRTTRRELRLSFYVPGLRRHDIRVLPLVEGDKTNTSVAALRCALCGRSAIYTSSHNSPNYVPHYRAAGATSACECVSFSAAGKRRAGEEGGGTRALAYVNAYARNTTTISFHLAVTNAISPSAAVYAVAFALFIIVPPDPQRLDARGLDDAISRRGPARTLGA